MKIALLSDIHSNIFALEAVLQDLKSKDIDILCNLGDILYGPIAPLKTYELLQKYNFITICGNQDRQIYEAQEEEINSNETMQFILKDLNEDILTWMKTLDFDKVLENHIYLCHGTPNDDLVYLLENIKDGTPKLKDEDEITSELKDIKQAIIICGHTHMPRVLLNKSKLIINPGSVGLQAYYDEEPKKHCMQNFTPEASYAILNLNQQKPLDSKVSLIRVPYAYEKAIELAKKRNRDDWAYALEMGKVDKTLIF